ncbi:MAG TPA: AgmX/PglI C-terminal domain-containing protein [Candidatus Binatia bacterium]|nr:AgmX/PglI C-terminal domain-containing protein [Candidatus Binatia bacterium]
MSQNKGRSGNRRVLIALASCVLGAGLILLASLMGSKSEDKPGAIEEDSHVKAQKGKIQRTWNVALGNVVVVAPDLGLSAKTLKGDEVDESRIAIRLESQLQSLREFYRAESDRDPTLMGEMLLEVTVSASGEVTHVKELASRIPDSEFKKTVLAEVSQWTFPEIITDSTTITCPILFVREGMDITTIVQWEKTLGQLTEKAAIAKANTQAIQQRRAQEGSKRSEPVAKTARVPNKAKNEQNTNVKSLPRTYQVKHPTTIREQPDFRSASVGKFAAGSRITIIAARGDWVEVRADDAGRTGFIRREFVTQSN